MKPKVEMHPRTTERNAPPQVDRFAMVPSQDDPEEGSQAGTAREAAPRSGGLRAAAALTLDAARVFHILRDAGFGRAYGPFREGAPDFSVALVDHANPVAGLMVRMNGHVRTTTGWTNLLPLANDVRDKFLVRAQEAVEQAGFVGRIEVVGRDAKALVVTEKVH